MRPFPRNQGLRSWSAILISLLAACGGGGGSSSGSGPSALIGVSPLSDFLSSGEVGGPFAPASKVYTISNLDVSPLDWTTTQPAAWLALDPTSGTLLPGESIEVTAAVDQVVAQTLTTGVYATSFSFDDAISGSVVVQAQLEVEDPPPIVPGSMLTATRTAGVAPLLVVFDAVNTANPPWNTGVAQPVDGDFSKFQYAWDFGDSAAGTWPLSSRSRDEDSGCVAAHVFEQPGVYTVSLRLLTDTDQEFFYSQEIDVLAFSGTTYYVSDSTGSNSNPGTSQLSPLKTFDAGIAKNGTNVRILFKRGDSFSTFGFRQVNATGPGIIGAYGSGARPVVSISSGTNDNSIIVFTGNDWRISDLAFVGAGRGVDQSGSVSLTSAKMRNLLALRIKTTECRVGMGWIDAAYPESHDAVGLVDCEISDCEVNGAYVGAKHLALLGNRIERMDTSHVLRVWQANKSVISHNLLSTPGTDRHCLKLHAPDQLLEPARLKSEYVQIADNEIRGIGKGSVAIGPQHSTADERVRHLVFERNKSYNAGTDVVVWARNITIRNNIFDGTGPTPYYTSVEISRRGVEPASDMVGVYNNTVYMSGTHQEIALARVDTMVTNTFVQNNIICAPNASVPVVLVDTTPSAGLNNLEVAVTDFVNAALGDFRLAVGAAGIDAAVALKQVRDDFAKLKRLLIPDLGAHER